MKNEKKELDKLERIGESMNVNKKTLEIWKRNLKQGYRFFQPHNAVQLTPRTLREADVQKKYHSIITTNKDCVISVVNLQNFLTALIIIGGVA